MLNHSLIRTLLSLRGNPKSIVLTEPLWGIPYNLIAPYVSVYMLTMGLKDSQIGLLISIGLIIQTISAFLSGPITDKLGRRKTTALFDFLSWSVPMLVWAVAQDFRYFLVAALFNGTWRITHTSWSCLLVEEADPEQLVDIYSWIYIANLLAGFFAPIAGLLIGAFSLVSTMRGLYVFAFVFMTAKFIILYFYSTETTQGQVRIQETQHQSLFSLLTGYGDVFKQMMRTPSTLYTLGILLVMNLTGTIGTAFWSILVTQKIHIPAEHIALYPFARSIIMMAFFFIAMPHIKEMKFRNPMMVGLGFLAISQLLLIVAPEKSYVLLLVSTFIEACSYATVSTQVDRMIAVTIDPQERARLMGLLFLTVIMVTTPFGWIAGQLSMVNRTLPFILDICLYGMGAVLVFLAARQAHKESIADKEPHQPTETEPQLG
jgi:MFS family permease